MTKNLFDVSLSNEFSLANRTEKQIVTKWSSQDLHAHDGNYAYGLNTLKNSDNSTSIRFEVYKFGIANSINIVQSLVVSPAGVDYKNLTNMDFCQ